MESYFDGGAYYDTAINLESIKGKMQKVKRPYYSSIEEGMSKLNEFLKNPPTIAKKCKDYTFEARNINFPQSYEIFQDFITFVDDEVSKISIT